MPVRTLTFKTRFAYPWDEYKLEIEIRKLCPHCETESLTRDGLQKLMRIPYRRAKYLCLLCRRTTVHPKIMAVPRINNVRRENEIRN